MSEFVPLNELEDYNSERLSWRLNVMEYVPSKNIGINVDRLEKLAKLAGLGHLRVASEAGDTTSYHASITSMDAAGNATAGRTTAVSKAELEKVDVEEGRLPSSELYDYYWANGQIIINSSELGQRIIHGRCGGGLLKDPRGWSYHLNKSLGEGIRKAAQDQLINNVPLTRRFAFCLTTGIVAGVAFLPDERLYNLPVNFAIQYGINFAITSFSVSKRFGLGIKDRRLSVFPGYQLDRLAAVNGISRATRLVKPLNSKSE